MSSDNKARRYTRVTASDPTEHSPLLSQPLPSRKLVEDDLVFDPTFDDYLQEFILLFRTAIPNISAYFLQAVMPLASVFAIGHIVSSRENLEIDLV